VIQQLLAIWHRLAALVRRRRLERDLDDEVAFHLAMREADYRRAGFSDAGARDEARRRFGNVAYLKEQTRDMWIFPSFENLRHDVRYALRTLRKSPGFTLVAVFALAVGIGGNTAIFSLMDAVRLQALPYRNPDRLMVLWGNVVRTKVERRGASYPDYLDWKAQATTFDGVAAFDNFSAILALGDEPERITVEMVSPQYFPLLGVNAALGRTFLEEEDGATNANAFLLGDALWKRRFGGDPQVVGRAVRLGARSFTIVGVMPAGFTGLTDTAEGWMPFVTAAGGPAAVGERGSRGFQVLGRLKPGVTPAQAQTDLDAVSRRLEAAYPDTNSKRAVEVSPLDAETFGPLRPALRTLMAAVIFVLLIACANVANLLIARSEARQREIALRTALGAGWPRLLGQLVTEGCVLTGLGAVVGVLLAQAAMRALVATSPVTFPSFVAPQVNLRVMLFTIAVSLAGGLLLGLAPAVHARIARLAEALKDSSRGSDGRRATRMRSALVVAEVSLAVVLLVGAGLMIRTVRNLVTLNPGFDPGSVLSLRISIPRGVPPAAQSPASPAAAPQTPPPLVASARVVLDRVKAVPGVASASLVSDVPLSGGGAAIFYTAEGQPPVDAQNVPRAYVHRVTPDFFATMRVPVKAGRSFNENEIAPESTAVVVSERVVTRFWPGQDPIGKRIKQGGLTNKSPWLSIVGVVGEMKYRGLPDNPTPDPDLYFPFIDRAQQVSLVVRTSAPPASLAPSVRAAVRSVDSTITIFDVTPLDELVGQQTAQSRFTMWLMGIFAACALMLAVVGIYGVMSYLVTQRTREIGIRLALGAGGPDILRLVVGNGARMIGAGIVIGVAAAFVLQRLVSTLLFGVTAADASSLFAVALLAAIALAACYLPALRATRVSPLNALRYE
jgi:putative ABC transport system permease protein